MSITWFAPGWIIDVPNPGYGELEIAAPTDPHDGEPLVTEHWERTLAGPQIGPWLSALTERAFQTDTDPVDPASGLPGFISPAAARALLPALQQAVVLATAGSEVYERTWRAEEESPPGPYCSRCGEGTLYTPGALRSDWCDQYGHQPYGMGADTTWKTAHRIHDNERRRWETLRELGELSQ